MDKKRLNGKVALITGGTTDIGLATANCFCKMEPRLSRNGHSELLKQFLIRKVSL